MRDISYFAGEFEKQIKKNQNFKSGNAEYGSNVMPILQLYKGLSSSNERKSFREALEEFLVDPDNKKRKFAVDVCLGFFVFRDAI